jgi:hypothetical protein
MFLSFPQIIDSYAPINTVTLATCVQNKAVDAIAEKLVKAATPFFVHGNDARLGLVAKEWTLAAQVERDPRVPPLRALVDVAAAKVQRWRNLRRTLFNAEDKAYAEREVETAQLKEAESEEQLDDMRARVCAELVRDTRAILCTVATASRSLLADKTIQPAVERITTAVLDEAGTCPETKLPLLLLLPELARIIAIGDHKQLQPFSHWTPPSIGRSGSSGKGRRGVCHFYNGTPGSCPRGAACRFSHDLTPRSAGGGGIGVGAEPVGFFQRVRAALPDGAVGSLLDQYRMHPSIAAFVSAAFYDDALRTPPAVAAQRAAADAHGMWWLAYPEAHAEGKRAGATSYSNDVEVATVMAVLRQLAQQSHRGGRSIMVITFYREQDAALRRGLSAAGLSERLGGSGGDGDDALRVMTVDQAQGSEADVVILSCVRSNAQRTLGFVADANRMNVAISRARERLVVVGDAATLCTDAKWSHLRACCRVISHAGELPSMPAAASR